MKLFLTILLMTTVINAVEHIFYGLLEGPGVYNKICQGDEFNLNYFIIYADDSQSSGTIISQQIVNKLESATFYLKKEEETPTKYLKVIPYKNGFTFNPSEVVIDPFKGETAFGKVETREFIVTDILPPTVDIIEPSGIIPVNKEDSIMFDIWDNSNFVSQYQLYLSIDDENFAPLCTVYTMGDIKKEIAWSPSYWTLKRIPYTPTIPGDYKIRIEVLDATGHMAVDTHSFSVVDIVKPTLSLISPIGSEKWKVGTSHNIKWVATDNVNILYRTINFYNGTNWILLDSATTNTGSWQWVIPDPPIILAKIKIYVSDKSGNTSESISSNFEITDSTTPVISDTTLPIANINSPTKESIIVKGSTHNITWSATDDRGIVSRALYLSVDNGSNYTKLDSTLGNTGAWSWNIPNTEFSYCYIKINTYDSTGNKGTGLSGLFNIKDTTTPFIKAITGPQANVMYHAGSKIFIIFFVSDGINFASQSIHYSLDNGKTYNLIDSTGWNGYFETIRWSTSQTMVSDQCKIRINIYDVNGNCESDYIPIQLIDAHKPTVSFTCFPDTIETDKSYNITWDAQDSMGIEYAVLYLSTDNNETYNKIDSISNIGLYTWTAPSIESSNCSFSIKVFDGSYIKIDTSETFKIKYFDKEPPTILITSVPNEIQTNTSQEVKWYSQDNMEMSHVIVYLSTDSGTSFDQLNTISLSRGDTGIYVWVTPNSNRIGCQLKLHAHDISGNIGEVKSNLFNILLPTSIKNKNNRPKKFGVMITNKNIIIAMEKTALISTEIYTLNGRKVMSRMEMLTTGYHKIQKITVKGIYILRIKRIDTQFIKKLNF